MKLNNDKILNACALAARTGSKILDLVTNIALILIFLFVCYSLFDMWSIFKDASVNDKLLQYKPKLEEIEEENPSILELMERYEDARAWLAIYDTNIDYPVVQSNDNKKYVNSNIDGEFSLSGEIFLDFRNSPDFSDYYSILYGHHMDLQAMFGGLDLFLEKEYFDKHKDGVLFLPESTDKIEIFASVSSDAYDNILFDTNKSTIELREELINYIKDNAVQYRDIGVDVEDRIITFSTCSSDGVNARNLVFGVLTKGISAEMEGEVD